MLSGAATCQLLDEILTAILQNQILIATFIDKKDYSYCHQLLVSYSCYPLSYFLQLFQNVTVDGCNVNLTHQNIVEVYSSDIPIAKHVGIYWIPLSVLCTCFFNGNINYS